MMFKLRELERKDIPEITVWRNDPELIDSLGAPFRFINQEVDYKWFDNYIDNRGSMVRCAITEVGNDMIIGVISLISIDYLNQSAELHIMIGNKENQRRGVGTYAVRKILQHGFANMNLHRIELSVLEDNLGAQRLYEKVGFVREGVLRKAKFKNGKFENVYEYAILREEWENPPI